MASGAKILNEKDLYAKFHRLDELTQSRYLKNACYAGGLPILNKAIYLVAKKSSTLSRSLHIEVTEQAAKYVEISIGTNLVYAARIEFGFNDVDSLGREYHQPAQPYLRPAFLTERRKAVAEIHDSLRDILLALAA